MAMNPPIRNWQGLRVWIIGASDGIGAALVAPLVERGARVALSARNAEGLQQVANQAKAKDAQILPLDVTDAQAFLAGAQTLQTAWGGVDLVLHVAGTYVPMRAKRFDMEAAKYITDVNILGVYHMLAAVLPILHTQRSGGVGIVGSVAGYSGLPKALVYGPSKAAIINLCESLYIDMHPKGLGVYMISPGFVRTRLTSVNDFTMPALIEADEAADHIIAGLSRGAFDIHFPKRFSRLLKFLRLLPYPLYFWFLRKLGL